MTNLIGLPLETVVATLESRGYQVETVEVRSRKGVDGDCLRVIRILPLDGNTVQVAYSEFLTKVKRT